MREVFGKYKSSCINFPRFLRAKVINPTTALSTQYVETDTRLQM
jgi:hypothetical protein